jgi:hypothetical protein
MCLQEPSDGTYLDLDDFDTLVFSVRGDGRKYIANIRAENYVVEQSFDIYQAFLFCRCVPHSAAGLRQIKLKTSFAALKVCCHTGQTNGRTCPFR